MTLTLPRRGQGGFPVCRQVGDDPAGPWLQVGGHLYPGRAGSGLRTWVGVAWTSVSNPDLSGGPGWQGRRVSRAQVGGEGQRLQHVPGQNEGGGRGPWPCWRGTWREDLWLAGQLHNPGPVPTSEEGSGDPERPQAQPWVALTRMQGCWTTWSVPETKKMWTQ